MSKSELVKIGVAPAQAQSLKRDRRLRDLLAQQDATIERVRANTWARIQELAKVQSDDDVQEPPAAATA